MSSAFIASFAFVKQMHRAMPLPLYTFSDTDNTHSEDLFLYYRKLRNINLAAFYPKMGVSSDSKQ